MKLEVFIERLESLNTVKSLHLVKKQNELNLGTEFKKHLMIRQKLPVQLKVVSKVDLPARYLEFKHSFHPHNLQIPLFETQMTLLINR